MMLKILIYKRMGKKYFFWLALLIYGQEQA